MRAEENAYAASHPTGEDAILVIEAALTSQAVDRAKAHVYARAGIATYWLLDLDSRRLEIRSSPTDDGYEVTTVLAPNQSVALPNSDDEWSVASMLVTTPQITTL